ncbi:PD-(D/E)XK motif protein [Zobellia galactanivorans]|uniref:PD-(D/E)XK motif protein n=1 Tax=Zobellia galactanivorans (strain DSM 12802 / CCUG 47099 / CIP 106680 / NCIMB 13871 / Dsij) TaxID=63186 RepID=UPI0026E3BE9D|nr:PD-(D/E)XK motif protein [Zobellia galactanivorans]MDO6809883.1 PD-(D/E)XK motif protein [Zobellia galactanivorans]
MEKTKIEKIWHTLENDSSSFSGLLYKRYSAKVLPDVFIAIKAPEKLRCIAFKISASFSFDENQWNKLKDIKIEILPDERDQSKKFLLILLLNRQHKDIFSTLCEDLIFGVSDITSEESLVEKLLERLAKWQSLFEKIGKQGLSDEAQRGLYGELYFLRLFLNNTSDKTHCLKSWLGPEKAIQDFQYSNWAVEVKTTHGKNHQKIHITSERQLDDSIIEMIFLYHLSLDIRVGNGESLNSLVDEILEILEDDTIASNLCKLKLLESGYYDVHRPFYEEKGYMVRQENIYRVSDNFPRITENQVPEGVGDVKYSIVLSKSEDWRINIDTLFNNINQPLYGK